MYSFKGVKAASLQNVIGAYREGQLSKKSLTAFLSFIEEEANAETRIRSIKAKTGKEPHGDIFRKKTLLAKASWPSKADLRKLLCLGILTEREGEFALNDALLPFAELSNRRSPARLIPVPREMLRALISDGRPSLVLSALTYFLFGLSFERGTGAVKNKGSIKATKISELTGLSLRSVRAARAELIFMGWISRDEASTQWKLNRTGAYFEINCGWQRPEKRRDLLPEKRRGHLEPRSDLAVENAHRLSPKSAPLPPQNGANFSPPIKRPERFFQNHKNQKAPIAAVPATAGSNNIPGFCMEKEGQGKEPPPNIRNIKLIDFKKSHRLQLLYSEFVTAGQLQPSEASAINFAAAAVRAGRLELPDDRRVRVFLGIIKRRLWGNITQAEEDRALSVIRRCREKEPNFMRHPALASSPRQCYAPLVQAEGLLRDVMRGLSVL